MALTYPFDQKVKLKIFNGMAEILGALMKNTSFVFKPIEYDIAEVALRLLAEHGVIMYQWNPRDPRAKTEPAPILVGHAYVMLAIGQYLQLYDNDHYMNVGVRTDGDISGPADVTSELLFGPKQIQVPGTEKL